MKWVQDERGELTLTPVGKEITCVPALLSLAPGASRNVRVGADAAARKTSGPGRTATR
jgi:hypothetical protein